LAVGEKEQACAAADTLVARLDAVKGIARFLQGTCRRAQGYLAAGLVYRAAGREAQAAAAFEAARQSNRRCRFGRRADAVLAGSDYGTLETLPGVNVDDYFPADVPPASEIELLIGWCHSGGNVAAYSYVAAFVCPWIDPVWITAVCLGAGGIGVIKQRMR
jgi:hypothetical protein